MLIIGAVLGSILTIVVPAVGKFATRYWDDRRAVDYVRNHSGLTLPEGIRVIVREDEYSIIPSDGHGTWVFALPDGPELAELHRCLGPGYTRGNLADSGIYILSVEKYVVPIKGPVCYRWTSGDRPDTHELYVLQDRRLVYNYMY